MTATLPRRSVRPLSVPEQILAVTFFVASALLVAAGVAKLRSPGPAARAMTTAGLPATALAGRAIGAVEMVAGVAGLMRPGPIVAAAVGFLYLAFAVFLVRLMSTRRAAGCGCLGRRETPPSRLHVGLNLVAAGAAVAVAFAPPPAIVDLARATPWNGLPFVAGLLTAGYALYLLVAFLPTVFFSWSRAGD